MRRLISVFILFVCLSILCGCDSRSYGIIPFEDKNAEAECTVNGKFNIIIKKEDSHLALSVLSPEELCGMEFVFSDTDCYVTSQSVRIPISKEDFMGVYAIASLLTLQEDMLCSAVSKDGYGKVELLTELGTYSLIYDSRGDLIKAEIYSENYEYSIDITGLNIQK